MLGIKKGFDVKRLILNEVDGFFVVARIEVPMVDGVRTRKLIDEKARKTKVYKDTHRLAVRMERLKQENKHGKHTEEIKKLKEDHALKVAELKDEMLNLFLDNKIYFGLRKNEIELNENQESEVKSLIASSRDEAVVLEKSTGKFKKVVNLKGKRYFLKDENGKWEEKVIEKIGEEVPVGAEDEEPIVEYDKPSPSEIKEFAKKDALRIAASKINEFKILGDSDDVAIKKSREFYDAEIKRIDKQFV